MSVSVGDEVSEGDLILTLDGRRGSATSRADSEEEPSRGRGPGGARRGARRGRGREPAAGSTSDPSAAGREEAEATPQEQTPAASGSGGGPAESVYAGPGTRALARELGVDLAAVAGTGHKGRITREDVTAAAEGGGAPAAGPGDGRPPAPPPGPAGLPAWPQVDFARLRPGRARAAVAHQAHRRPGARPQLGR